MNANTTTLFGREAETNPNMGRAAAFLFAALSIASPANAGDAAGDSPNHQSHLTIGATMTQLSFGEHSKLIVQPSDRKAVRRFYRDVLGCPQTRESERIDTFKIGATFFLGVIYDDTAPSADDRLKSIWLELRVADPAATRQKILDFGIKGIEYTDKEHFYFQAPGGQVYRLVGDTEDMSKWER
jgi:hypothetical protein